MNPTAAAAAAAGANGPIVAASLQMLGNVPAVTQNPVVAVAAAPNCFAVARASGSITKYRCVSLNHLINISISHFHPQNQICIFVFSIVNKKSFIPSSNF